MGSFLLDILEFVILVLFLKAMARSSGRYSVHPGFAFGPRWAGHRRPRPLHRIAEKWLAIPYAACLFPRNSPIN